MTQPTVVQPIVRFDGGERVLHWTNATLFLTLLGTGAILYVPQLSEVFGRRHTIEIIHVVCGLALPFPVALTLLSGPWGRAFRKDIRRLNRWSPADRKWFRIRGRNRAAKIGTFNPRHKLNAAFTACPTPPRPTPRHA